MPESLVTVVYIVAGLLFIMSLSGLSAQATAGRGNLFGIVGMILAAVATALSPKAGGYPVMAGAMAVGSAIGAVLGAQANIALTGLDFVLASLFAVLTVEQWRTRKSSAPLWVALIAYGIAYPLAAKHALVISIAICLIAGIFWPASARKTGTESLP